MLSRIEIHRLRIEPGAIIGSHTFGEGGIPDIGDSDSEQPGGLFRIAARPFFEGDTMFQVVESFPEAMIALRLPPYCIEDGSGKLHGLIHKDSIVLLAVGEYGDLNNAQPHEGLILAEFPGHG